MNDKERIAELERELARVKEQRRIFCNEVLARDRLVEELEREVPLTIKECRDGVYAGLKCLIMQGEVELFGPRQLGYTHVHKDKVEEKAKWIVAAVNELSALKHHNAKLVVALDSCFDYCEKNCIGNVQAMREALSITPANVLDEVKPMNMTLDEQIIKKATNWLERDYPEQVWEDHSPAMRQHYINCAAHALDEVKKEKDDSKLLSSILQYLNSDICGNAQDFKNIEHMIREHYKLRSLAKKEGGV